MTEQVLDVRGWVRLLRRFWRTVAVCALAGIAAATADVLLVGPRYQASSLVLLPAQPTTSSATASTTHDVTTEARVAESGAVLEPAGRAVDRSLSLADLQSRVSASSSATSVLRITARGDTPKQAEALANAVANQLVTFIATNGSTAGSNVVAALHSESRQIDQQLTNVNAELKAANQRLSSDRGTSARHQADQALVSTLTGEQSTLTLQLNAVKSQVQQAGLEELAANQGTQVLQRATTATPPSVSSLALPLLLGMLGGLLAGSLVVLTRHRRDPRLRTRDAMAEAVGAPVVAALSIPRRRTPGDWTTLLEEYQPSALEQWTLRRALREIGAGEGRARRLTVLAMAGDPAGIAQAAHVAVCAATSGSRTAFGVTAGDEGSRSLRSVCARMAAESRRPRPELRVVEPAVDQGAEGPTPADLVVEAVVLDPDHPADVHPGRPGTVAVLSVSAGAASAEQLAATAIAAADGGQAVQGILVANPTSADRTVGRFADTAPSRTALPGRRAAAKPEAASGRAR